MEQALEADGRGSAGSGLRTRCRPATVFTGSALRSSVFTPFSRAWRDHGWDAPVRRAARPNWTTGVRSDGMPKAPPSMPSCPSPVSGPRRSGRRVSRRTRSSTTPTAATTRAPTRTSRLSPYLKCGCVHPRQLLDRLGRGEGAEHVRDRAGVAGVLCRRVATTGRRRRAGVVEKMAAMPPTTGGGPTSGSRPGARAGPATRSSTPGCANCSPRAGCTTGSG